MYRIFLKFCYLLLFLPIPILATEAAQIEIATSHNANAVDVKVQAVIAATPKVIWATLTDYERMPEFIPGLMASRVIERKGSVATIRQSGIAQFLFFKIPIEVTVESQEAWPILEGKRISGTVRQLQGRYEMIITPDSPKVRLVWTGVIEPENSLPPLIGESFMHRAIREQFTAMVREIERRASQ
jgi:ribosome-associated toxin RatA of RatAB toxin-antitoxin module